MLTQISYLDACSKLNALVWTIALSIFSKVDNLRSDTNFSKGLTKLGILPHKAWLATYFELPHPQPRNPKFLRTRNRAQLAFLVVATRKRNRNFIKFI